MKRLLILIIVFCLLATTPAFSGTVLWETLINNPCSWDNFNSRDDGEYTFGYFNGEGLNTYWDAKNELKIYKELHAPFNHLYRGRQINYKLFFSSMGGITDETERQLLQRAENVGTYDFKEHYDILMAGYKRAVDASESIPDIFFELAFRYVPGGILIGKFVNFLKLQYQEFTSETLRLMNDMGDAIPGFIEEYSFSKQSL